MTSDILRNYEQQFGVLCADITNKISISVNSSDRKSSIATIEGLFQDALEIIEQMELEIRDANSSKKRTEEQKEKYLNIINSYKAELSQLEKEFDRQVRNKNSNMSSNANFEIQLNENNPEDSELFDLKRKNTENLNKMNRNLENGYRMVLESEETGNNILSDLFGQREQMTRARDRLREVNNNLGKSSRVVGIMTRKALQNKLILFGMIVFLILTVVFVIYLVIKKKLS